MNSLLPLLCCWLRGQALYETMLVIERLLSHKKAKLLIQPLIVTERTVVHLYSVQKSTGNDQRGIASQVTFFMLVREDLSQAAVQEGLLCFAASVTPQAHSTFIDYFLSPA